MRKILLTLCLLLFMSSAVFGAAKIAKKEKEALSSAINYVAVIAFSYKGLVNQLQMFDGYSRSEAEYAAKNCGADWNKQAVRRVREYLDIMPMSRSRLIEQLVVFDGFTRDQATFGVRQAGY